MAIDKDKIKKAIIQGKITDKTTLQIFAQNEDLKDELSAKILDLKAKVYEAVKTVKESEINLPRVLENIRGSDGEKGEQGIQGKKGDTGEPGVPGLNGLDGAIGLDGKDGSPDTRLQIVEKINTGKKDDLKIEVSQLEGFGKIETDITNRALSILDQRTKFLINKTGGGSGSGTVGPGTTNELAYFNSTTTVASLTTATYPSLTELSYVKGVTSAIQTQIDSKGTGTVTSVSGTTDRITSTGGATPVIDISASYVGQSSITTLGTVTTGTWSASVIGPAYGGTGVANNAAMTVTGSGNYAYTRTLTGATNVTFPTTGTLATLAGTEELDNKTLDSSVGKGTWTASGTWTLPALTLGGTVSGGGNQLNNIIIGTSTPLAGTFTTLAATSANSLGLGAASAAVGSVTLFNGTNSNNVKIQSGTTSASYTLTLPTAVAAVTGYVLSSTDAGVLSWIAGGGMTNPLTTTGDIIYSSSGTTPARLAIGATGTVLQGGTIPSWSGAATDGDGLQRNNTGFLTAPLRTLPQGRLTLTTAVPVTTADVTAALVVYFTPYKGDVIPTFDGTRWKLQTFTEKSIKTTDSASGGTATQGSAVITAITPGTTAQLMRGMKVTGAKIPANSTISSIDSATQITINNMVSETTGSTDLTFKLPAGKNYDIFYVQSTGTIQFSNAWSGDNARTDAISLQNGLYVNTSAINSADSNTIAAKTGTYLGTIRTTATDGQTEDSFGGASQAGGHRYVWNNYNRIERNIGVVDTTDNWTYTTETYHQANANSGNKVELVIGVADVLVGATVHALASATNGITLGVGVGLDSTTVSSAQNMGGFGNGFNDSNFARYEGYPTIGYHALNWIEISVASGTTTWRGDSAVTYIRTGLIATLLG